MKIYLCSAIFKATKQLCGEKDSCVNSKFCGHNFSLHNFVGQKWEVEWKQAVSELYLSGGKYLAQHANKNLSAAFVVFSTQSVACEKRICGDLSEGAHIISAERTETTPSIHNRI